MALYNKYNLNIWEELDTFGSQVHKKPIQKEGAAVPELIVLLLDIILR